MKTLFEHKYEIGDEIFHITPESSKGVIVDISYSKLTGLVVYTVSFGRLAEDQVTCFEHELSKTKRF